MTFILRTFDKNFAQLQLPTSLPSWFGITARNRPTCSPVLRRGKMRTKIYSPCRPGLWNDISI
nr:MAG TPA: hypothetical protein [Caudoviricetes sp.]